MQTVPLWLVLLLGAILLGAVPFGIRYLLNFIRDSRTNYTRMMWPRDLRGRRIK